MPTNTLPPPRAVGTLAAPPKRSKPVANRESAPDLSTFRGRMAALVRARRKRLGLSQADLLKRLRDAGLDISDRSVSAYEIGTRPIQIDDLPAFAQALETTPKRLIPD